MIRILKFSLTSLWHFGKHYFLLCFFKGIFEEFVLRFRIDVLFLWNFGDLAFALDIKYIMLYLKLAILW